MQTEKSILDKIYNYVGRFIIYPNEHAKVAHTLWIAGSYFPEFPDIPVFDNYPILAFLSPDEDNGKSRALKVTQLLAYNAIDGGSYTAPALCREIDQQAALPKPKMITMILDELDEILTANRDNADYVRLLNNGYERGQFIVRASLNNEGENKKTMAYSRISLAAINISLAALRRQWKPSVSPFSSSC
jgi:hypothetical protein